MSVFKHANLNEEEWKKIMSEYDQNGDGLVIRLI